MPGGPYSSTPLGTRAPSFWKRRGSRRNSTISSSSARASSTPATSSQRTLELDLGSIVFGFVLGIARTSFHVRNTSSAKHNGMNQVNRNACNASMMSLSI